MPYKYIHWSKESEWMIVIRSLNGFVTFQNITNMAYLAPSLHWEFGILKLNVKRAPDLW